LAVQGAKYILHTHTKKRRKKSSRKMGSSPQFLKSQSKKWHSSLCLPSGTELHKSGNNSRDQMHLLPKPGFSGFAPLARVVCFFDPRGHSWSVPISFLHSLPFAWLLVRYPLLHIQPQILSPHTLAQTRSIKPQRETSKEAKPHIKKPSMPRDPVYPSLEALRHFYPLGASPESVHLFSSVISLFVLLYLSLDCYV
jgi:hypothetical protein